MKNTIMRNAGRVMVFFIICLIGVGRIAFAQGFISLQGENDGEKVLLKWQADNRSSVYQIQKSLSKEGNFTVMATLSGQKGEIVIYDYDVKKGNSYYYKVALVEKGRVSSESSVVEVKLTLKAPDNIKIKSIKDTKVKLTWKKTKDATGYEIYRSKTPDYKFKKIGTSEKSSYTDDTVKKGKVYYYRVIAIDHKREELTSTYGETVTVCIVPGTPKVNGDYSKKKIKITWKKVSGAQMYTIYRKKSNGKFKKIGETNKLFFLDKDVKKGKYYEYQVIAFYKKEDQIIRSDASASCKVFASDVDPNKKMVALTFDDGPGKYTQEIVDCLKANNARATFFVLGCNVDSYKSSMQAADKIGCEIASHTYNHRNLVRLSETEIVEEVEKTDRKIEKAIGKMPNLVRTPGGSVNDTVKEVIGKPIILWSIDTLDWKTRNRDKTVKAVMDHVKDGDIVLMHDIHEPSKEAALILIPRLQREGYQLVTVSELAKYRNHTLKKGEVYHSLRH